MSTECKQGRFTVKSLTLTGKDVAMLIEALHAYDYPGDIAGEYKELRALVSHSKNIRLVFNTK